MSDIVKGIIGGGWPLLIGWILPAALNVLVFVLVVLPGAGLAGARGISQDGLLVGLAAVVVGLLLAAVQTPLYRLLEGYVGWRPKVGEPHGWRPGAVLERWRRRQIERRQVLLGRVDLVELTQLEDAGRLTDADDRERLAEVRADPRLEPYRADLARSASQLGLLRERLGRYPVDERQVVPTRLGNAIRRLEEYGYDRFRLDSQRMWYELSAAAPERTTKQVEQARTTVDMTIAMLYGNLLLAVATLGCTLVAAPGAWPLYLLAVAAFALTRVWYELAIRATDDWAAGVRSLVNLGRQPLAEAMGLRLPDTIAAERDMWSKVASTVARPYHPRRAALDKYRAAPPEQTAEELGSDPPPTGQ
ncbi:hypothetical protein [Phytohabitans kaempferiae]|uniref:DUF4239 domain-containing protein n=1 Tax=Phytohabitans kaempferiae TaxID=1620943 RepID=A0ABV6LXW1_9ACTN